MAHWLTNPVLREPRRVGIDLSNSNGQNRAMPTNVPTAGQKARMRAALGEEPSDPKDFTTVQLAVPVEDHQRVVARHDALGELCEKMRLALGRWIAQHPAGCPCSFCDETRGLISTKV